MGHAKLALRERVLRSSVPDDPFMQRELRGYFPRRLLDATGELYREHPLRREIAATIATNEVVNDLGISWVWRCVAETGAEHADVVRAFYVARAVCHAKDRWDVVEALFADPRIDTATQMELMHSVDWLVESLARWYLREHHLDDMTGLIERDEPAFVELAAGLRQLGSSEWRAERALRREALVARGRHRRGGRGDRLASRAHLRAGRHRRGAQLGPHALGGGDGVLRPRRASPPRLARAGPDRRRADQPLAALGARRRIDDDLPRAAARADRARAARGTGRAGRGRRSSTSSTSEQTP